LGGSIVVIQKWEGVVDEIQGDIIYVSLLDLNHGGEDSSEISYSDINDDDHDLVRVRAK
jgi:hypothetical protein